jgi:hypothetical protein
MKRIFLLAAGSLLLSGTAPTSPAIAQAGLTCQAALDGTDFGTGRSPQTSDCCYVEPENTWYVQNDVWLHRFYKRADASVVFTTTCTVGALDEHRAAGSAVAPAAGSVPPVVHTGGITPLSGESKGFDPGFGQTKTDRDNGKGNGVDPAPGGSGDKRGDDADGANTPGTVDTSSVSQKGKQKD